MPKIVTCDKFVSESRLHLHKKDYDPSPPGTVMEVTDKHFAKYMDSFWPYLVASLQNHAEYSVCAASVGIVGDMCRTFGAEMANFSDKLMDMLVAALSVSCYQLFYFALYQCTSRVFS